MSKKILGILILFLGINSPMITTAVLLDTKTVTTQNMMNSKNTISKALICYDIWWEYIFAEAAIDSSYTINNCETFITSLHVKNIFFIGCVDLLYDDNISMQQYVLFRNVLEPYSIRGIIFQPLLPSQE